MTSDELNDLTCEELLDRVAHPELYPPKAPAASPPGPGPTADAQWRAEIEARLTELDEGHSECLDEANRRIAELTEGLDDLRTLVEALTVEVIDALPARVRALEQGRSRRQR